MIILSGFVGIALFFSFMAWVTAAPLRRLVALEERVNDAIKKVNTRFATHHERIRVIEEGDVPPQQPEKNYRENAKPSASEDEPESKKPTKPFVYGQRVDVLLGDDGFEDVEHPLRPMFSATFLGFGKGVDAATVMVLLKVGEMPMESFQLSEIQLFHPEAP